MNNRMQVPWVLPVDYLYGELLTEIYQGGGQPRRWDKFLERLRLHTNSEVATICFRSHSRRIAPAPLWNSKVAPSVKALDDYTKLQAELGYPDPLIETLEKTGGSFTLDQVISHAALKSSPYYLKLMKPFGLEHSVAVKVNGTEGYDAYIGLIRGPHEPNFEDSIRDLLLELGRHFQQALKIHAAQERAEQEKKIYSDTLSRFDVGTVILDSKGEIIDINDAAKDMLKRNCCLALSEGRLVPTKSKYREEYSRLISNAILWQENKRAESYVEAIRIECSSGDDVGALIRSLPNSSFFNQKSPCVIIHLEDFSKVERAPEDIVARLFRLSRSEARLATYLAANKTLTEAAEILGLTESSVRTYSKKIFSKLGVGRQAELVRLIATSVAVLGKTESKGQK